MIIKPINKYHKNHVYKFRGLVVFALISIIVILTIPFYHFLDDGYWSFAFVGVLFMSIILIYGLMITFGGQYCAFVPYFEKEIGHNQKTYGFGQEISKVFDLLTCKSQIGNSLDDFISIDSYKNNKINWHNAADGVELIDCILINSQVSESAKLELLNIKNALLCASKRNVKFCFHFKFIDGTNAMEHEQRQGSYF